MEQVLSQLLSNVVGILASILASVLIRLCAKWLGKVKMQKVQELMNAQKGIVGEALKSVEHKFGDLDGQIKFAQASNMISQQCAKFGVKIDATTIEMLIDSGLKEFKLQFGEQWKSATSTNSDIPIQDERVNQYGDYTDMVQKVTQTSV